MYILQYNYLDMTEMPNKSMTYFRMYCNNFPIVLNIIIHFQILKRSYHIFIMFELFLYIMFILLLSLLCYHYLLLFYYYLLLFGREIEEGKYKEKKRGG